jgi:hypothetical protein
MANDADTDTSPTAYGMLMPGGERQATDNTITVWRGDDGEQKLLCGHCLTAMPYGGPLCCRWAQAMYYKYFIMPKLGL